MFGFQQNGDSRIHTKNKIFEEQAKLCHKIVEEQAMLCDKVTVLVNDISIANEKVGLLPLQWKSTQEMRQGKVHLYLQARR